MESPPSWTNTRLERPDELDRVAALAAASFAHPSTRDVLARELQDSKVTRMYVLRLPGRGIVAFCACWLVVDEAHINTLSVDSSVRRQGLATALLEHVLADAAAEGATSATLEVRRSNAAALGLYGRFGFRIAAVRPNYYTDPGEDGLILWRRDLGVQRADSHP